MAKAVKLATPSKQNCNYSLPLSQKLGARAGISGAQIQMSNRFILVDLDKEQKAIIINKALFYIYDNETKEDLNNKRKKWIRFKRTTLTEIIGELSYYFNRSNDAYESMLLDELISHLEYFER